MKRMTGLWLLAFALITGIASAQPVMGNWQGEFTSTDWKTNTLRAQIVGESRSDYRAYFYVAEKDGLEQQGVIKGKTVKTITTFLGDIQLGEKLGGLYTLKAEVIKGVFTGKLKSKSGSTSASFKMKRVFLKSPTLGMKPPAGATVLMMDHGNNPAEQKELFAKQRDLFFNNWTTQPRWDVMSDGSIRMKGSSITSKEEFGSFLLHLEFRTPYMPDDRGQARGNSGLYVQGRYEVQILDSYTDPTRDDHCGGIYKQAVPLLNACLPPNEWQTYDIEFTAPKFNADDKKFKNARLSVKHNGKVIHDDIELRRCTPGNMYGDKEAPTGRMFIQDHGDYPSFKNAWIKPLN
jgi:3-keto-disaccharide hydrolase